MGDAKMRGHDIEEFQCIIERYGLWDSSLKAIAPAFESVFQTRMNFGDAQGDLVAVKPEMIPAMAE